MGWPDGRGEKSMDGISLHELVIDDEARGLFRVNRRIFTDPEYLALERQRIFETCWIYAAHESELPQPGDFVSRRVAGHPVIVVRGSDGGVRVMLNTCTHRGALVCREDRGNAKSFQCPYHAWTFDLGGALVGVPGEDAYSSAFDRNELALGQPARADSYRGFIFINFNRDAEDLTDYLAGAREYLDLVCDQSEAGMRVNRGLQAYSIRANWKLLVENSYDGYHAVSAHNRYMRFLEDTGIDLKNTMKPRREVDLGTSGAQGSRAIDLGKGHAVIEYESPWGRPIAYWAPSFGESAKPRIEAARRRLEQRFGAERAWRICATSRNLGIFPNLVVNDIMAVTIRTFFPVTPDYLEVNAWSLAPTDEHPEDAALRLDNFLTFLGPGGFATPDDIEMLETCQRGFANNEVQWSDISRGMKSAHPIMSDEQQMRVFWRRWNELIKTAPTGKVQRAA